MRVELSKLKAKKSSKKYYLSPEMPKSEIKKIAKKLEEFVTKLKGKEVTSVSKNTWEWKSGGKQSYFKANILRLDFKHKDKKVGYLQYGLEGLEYKGIFGGMVEKEEDELTKILDTIDKYINPKKMNKKPDDFED